MELPVCECDDSCWRYLIWKYHGQAVAYIYDTSSETVLGGFEISFNSVMNGLVRSEAKLNMSQ